MSIFTPAPSRAVPLVRGGWEGFFFNGMGPEELTLIPLRLEIVG